MINPTQHKQFYGLNLLRGIATLSIFIHHIAGGKNWHITNAFGDCFVAFFFILSGFLSTAMIHRQGYNDALNIKSVTRFMAKKVAKLYPIYILSFIAALVLSDNYIYTPIKVLLLNAAMLQSWIPNHHVFFSGNSVSWFISSLMFCYLMLLPTYKLMTKHPHLFWTISGILYISYFIIIQHVPHELTLPIIYINPIMQFFAFLFGMILWDIFIKIKYSTTLNIGYAQTICWLAFATIIILCRYVPLRYTLASYWWPIWGAIIFITAKGDELNIAKNATNFTTKALLFISKLSYPFFMLHYIVINTYRQKCHYSGFNSPMLLTIAITFIITLSASYLVQRTITAMRTALTK